jgi:hypothetical protein
MTDQWTGRWLPAHEHAPVAAGGGSRRARKADRRDRRELARLVRRLHDARAGRRGTARVVRSLTSVVSMVGGGPRLARPGAIALAHPSRVSMSLDECRVATGARSD